ncbi:MAG: divergent polysaccharide deacetylase family protein [Deferribacteraceae bacterium]|jgi:polysaccharide deacetylase 2 family uncharacterized protein YibQ|nr:divergent polysaccharide deacetylase family protein [Deferribacteraceae bacterium]
MKNNEEFDQEEEEVAKPIVKDGLKAKIVNKIKGSSVTVIAVLAAALVVLVATSVALIIHSNTATPILPTYTTTPTEVVDTDNNTPPSAPVVTITYNEFLKQLKLMLFEQNIASESISETYNYTGSTPNIHMLEISIPADKSNSVMNELIYLLERNRLPRLYSEGSNIFITTTADWRAEITITAITIAPPVEIVKYPFGVTPPARGSGKIALLIDDAGMNLELAETLLNIKVPVALAVLPHLPYSKQTADLIRAKQKTVFLHFPMEPLNYPIADPGAGAVLLNMPESLIQQIVAQNVENLGKIDGTNNHMGSAVTENADKMKQIMNSLRPYTTSFVDSNTSPNTVAYDICVEQGFRCGINKKFLDNENDHAYIASKLYEAAELANTQGGVIAIGHLRPDTILVLQEIVPELQKLGYSFVAISSLMK